MKKSCILEKCIEKANNGDAFEQFMVGSMYDNGIETEQSYEKAAEWYMKAAEQENADAQSRLGELYAYGEGVEQSYEKAAEWYMKAAENGEANAQVNLGFLYTHGRGVEQSYEKAAEWYMKAAEQNYVNGMFNLAGMYYDGKGVKQSYKEAMKWYRKALGQMEEGTWSVTDDKEIWHWKPTGPELGSVQYAIGRMYEYGRGVKQSYEEAMKWYKKSARQGLGTFEYTREAYEKLKNSEDMADLI